MPLDRIGRDAVGGQTLAQPSGVVGQHDIGGIRFQKRLVVLRALRLLAVASPARD